MTATCPCRGSSNTPGVYRKAIRGPSGDQDGPPHRPWVPVRTDGPPPSASIAYTSSAGTMSQSSWRPDTKANRLPSGDHAGLESCHSPEVTWVGFADPSAGTTNTWDGRSAVHPSLSSL